MINQFSNDSSLLFSEAMFSCSAAWHTVKDWLHYTLNSLRSWTSSKIWDLSCCSLAMSSRVRVGAHINRSNWCSELILCKIANQYLPTGNCCNVRVRRFWKEWDASRINGGYVVNLLWHCSYCALCTTWFFYWTWLLYIKMMHGYVLHPYAGFDTIADWHAQVQL